jgi:nucleotide-binding universal stress UspA family protein
VEVGEPASRILDIARALRPSLVALSTHGRAGLERFARGSTAERVLRHSPFPVLLVNPRGLAAPKEGRFERILVPVDGSELAGEVLPLATEIARRHGSEVILFHAVDMAVYLDPVPGVSPVETPEQVASLLKTFSARVKDVPSRALSAQGSPAAAILDAADSNGADLIALTTHGRSGPSRWLFGSVAEQVVRHARSPVLVHRTGGFAF